MLTLNTDAGVPSEAKILSVPVLAPEEPVTAGTGPTETYSA